MSKYDIDNVDEFDNLPDGKKDMTISGILFSLSYLSYRVVINRIAFILETTHTTRSLDAMIAAASLLVPISLLSGGLAELIAATYEHLKKKKHSVKNLTLTKE